ncbi:MAG: hypothetical protein K6F33_02510 [Bacteroidales bacterium]|nr:hypothetical protein [Bacteroidales bacterium]
MAQKDTPAYVILQTIAQEYDMPFDEHDVENADMDAIAEDGMQFGFSTESLNIVINCMQHKKGGYMALLSVENLVDFEFSYYSFQYNDGQLSNPSDVLPYPTIYDYFANSTEFPEEIQNEFVSIIRRPIYSYEPQEQILKVTFLLMYSKSDAVQKYAQAKIAISGPRIPYNWDGEHFVCDPNYKPLEEDLDYFK